MSNSHYALTNPLTLLLDKPNTEFTREDMIKIIEEKNIERITLHYTALDGKYKELRIPICNRMQAERILAGGERVDGSSLFKGMVDSSLSDLYVIPVYKSAFLNPFDSSSIDFTCRYIMADGNLAPFALDNILHNAYSLFKNHTGLEFYGLGELEFFLISGLKSPIYSLPKQRGYHASAPYIKSGQMVNEMVKYISQITGAVKYAHSEVGYVESVRSNLEEIKEKRAEQMEIEFLPTPITDTGDNLMLARWLIRNVAFKYESIATFTPKLEEGVAGNGLHVHMAIMKNGNNIMTDYNGNLSVLAKKIIGGLCKYADTLTAFGNTESSAYLRLVPNQEAPTRICWSDLNRSAMIRVPLGWTKVDNLSQKINPQQNNPFSETEGRQTVELRSPDGSALVYLLLAGITMAAEWGLTNDESLELANKLFVTGNIFHNKELLNSLPALPQSCVESARILFEKRQLYERDNIFPPSIIDYVSEILNREQDENMNQILADLPADDRLLETRKIMHKNIHRH